MHLAEFHFSERAAMSATAKAADCNIIAYCPLIEEASMCMDERRILAGAWYSKGLTSCLNDDRSSREGVTALCRQTSSSQ